MSIAAGGSIKQTIIRDKQEARDWDNDKTIVLSVQILDSKHITQVTGLRPPPSPISIQTYIANRIPFFNFYDEISEVHGNFGGLKPIDNFRGEGKNEKKSSSSSRNSGPVKLSPDAPARPFRHVSQLEEEIKKVNVVTFRNREETSVLPRHITPNSGPEQPISAAWTGVGIKPEPAVPTMPAYVSGKY
jgi:hypothetical protein